MGSRVVRVIVSKAGAVVILLAAVGLVALAVATSPEQPAASATDGLPAGKQSTKVTELADRFPSGREQSVVVVLERQGSALTDADQAAIKRLTTSLASVNGVDEVAQAIPSEDGQAMLIAVPLSVASTDEEASNQAVDDVRAAIRSSEVALPEGLSAQVTGGAAIGRDLSAAFDGADIKLLAATAGVVAVLLLLTYRSPFLWLIPLLVIGAADQLVAKVLPWVARLVGERTDASVSGIVSILVFGAGTDYALLLISRYREELRKNPDRRQAMTVALRGVTPAILASAGTVILALLTLLAAVLTSNRTLGISSAIGVAVALVFGLVVLPAALVCVPRGVFWPFVPKVGSADPSDTGLWARVAKGVGRRPVTVLLVSAVVLGALAAGLFGSRVGLSQTEQFRTKVESVTAQDALARHYPAGSSQPVSVIASASTVDAVQAAITGVPGVAGLAGPAETSDDGSLAQVQVQLDAESGTDAADSTVKALREAVSAVPGADALVGGTPAADLDTRDANLRDDLVIGPLILLVVLLVLIALLRALVAPLVLVITVVISYAASLGAATLVLQQFLDIDSLAANVPLLSFLFLVALGVDYNIFLVTRAREEAAESGDHLGGVLRALSATGGVITSAGILLAAVFTVLGVLPVIALTQIGVIVGIGVLLDTLLVRTVVVPALAILIGRRFWWPSALAMEPEKDTGAQVRSPSLVD